MVWYGLRHCSALLADGTVFQVDEDTPCRLAVSDSLFSCPAADGSATLVRHTLHDVAPTIVVPHSDEVESP